MNALGVKKYKTVFIHFGFWAFYLLLNGIAWTSFDKSYMRSSFQGILFLPVKMAAAYINFYWLMPVYLLRRRYWTYVVLVLSVITLGGLCQYSMVLLITRNVLQPSTHLTINQLFYVILQYIIPINSIVFFTAMIQLMQQWYLQKIKVEILAKENIHAELNYLKNQIHPHFLFNTLNNIYSLSLKKSSKTPEAILKLSELLSYMLYNSSNKPVALNKEVDSIINYIGLEKMRYGEDLDLNFTVSGKLSESCIESMILMPFIENCFKHVSSQPDQHSWIVIDLNIKKQVLNLHVSNSKYIVTGAFEPPTNGIGLSNVKRRLELLYPHAHVLSFLNEKDKFSANLQLNLDKIPVHAKD